jgi:hypothetical protein
MELFHLATPLRAESSVHITEAYALSKLFNTGNHLLIPPVSKEANKNKPRSKEGGSSCQELVHDLYWLGITHI